MPHLVHDVVPSWRITLPCGHLSIFENSIRPEIKNVCRRSLPKEFLEYLRQSIWNFDVIRRYIVSSFDFNTIYIINVLLGQENVIPHHDMVQIYEQSKLQDVENEL